MRRLRAVLLMACLIILLGVAGCSSITSQDTPSDETQTNSTTPPNYSTIDGYSLPHPSAYQATPSQDTDPESDAIGWEGGIWHDESLNIKSDDGYNKSELRVILNRTIARVETIRNEEFESKVTVTVKSPEEIRSSDVYRPQSKAHSRYNNIVWEGIFISSSTENISEQLGQSYSSSVNAYYSRSSNSIVIVQRNATRLNTPVLAHELVHALQDTRYGLDSDRLNPDTHDRQLATQGIIEGEARFIQKLYTQQCGFQWNCIETPEPRQPTQETNFGVQALIFQPYSSGLRYIASIYETQGWAGVDAEFSSPPQSTRAVMHPHSTTSTTEFESVNPTGNWSKLTLPGKQSTTIGEASLFMLFWYNEYTGYESTVEQGDITRNGQLVYEHPTSHGLVDDKFSPVENGNETGYVWQLEWETKGDAQEFENAYVTMLRDRGATNTGENTYWIPRGGYEGRFHILTDGTTTTLTHAPDETDLSDISPDPPSESTQDSILPSIELRSLATLLAIVGLIFFILFEFRND